MFNHFVPILNNSYHLFFGCENFCGQTISASRHCCQHLRSSARCSNKNWNYRPSVSFSHPLLVESWPGKLHPGRAPNLWTGGSAVGRKDDKTSLKIKLTFIQWIAAAPKSRDNVTDVINYRRENVAGKQSRSHKTTVAITEENYRWCTPTVHEALYDEMTCETVNKMLISLTRAMASCVNLSGERRPTDEVITYQRNPIHRLVTVSERNPRWEVLATG